MSASWEQFDQWQQDANAIEHSPLFEGLNEREAVLMERTIDFVDVTCPSLDVRDANAVVRKVFDAMRFTTKLPGAKRVHE